MRILLVEPSRTVRRIVTDLIEAWNHDVCSCADADDALLRLDSDSDIRALITSVALPSISGFQLVAQARAMVGTHRPLYIILMSSTDGYAMCIQALDNGADDFISKPPIAEELRARLRTADRVTAMQRELCRLASTDFLTGLPNRRAFFDNAVKAVEQAPHGRPLSALMLDLDRFKQINDLHSHNIGDEILKAVAAEIASLPGVTGRLGGEEFALLLAMRLEDAVEAADRLRQAISELAISALNATVTVTCSIGVAEWKQGDTIDTLLRRADVSLYEAKHCRNRVVAADSFTRSKDHEQWRGAARVAGR